MPTVEMPGFLNLLIEYLRENEKVRKTVFTCSYGAQVESVKQKNGATHVDNSNKFTFGYL